MSGSTSPSAIRARAVNAPKDWDAAKEIAREIVGAARSHPGVRYYEMYVDEVNGHLVNLAEYDDEAAWRGWIDTNSPRGKRLMETVDLVSMEVYGDLSPELAEAIARYGSSVVYTQLPDA